MADWHDGDRHPDIRDDVPSKSADEHQSWLDSHGTVRMIVVAICVLCVALLAVDPLVYKHGPFAIEHIWGFYGLYALIGCSVLVVVAKVLRLVVMQPEDYWERIEGKGDRDDR